MSDGCWTHMLKQTLTGLEARNKRPPRTALVGVGHELRGDDAAGMMAARRLRPCAHEGLLVVEGGHAPENHTGLLRRFNPDLVLLVDCAQMDEPPGTVRWLRWQDTRGLSASTHTMPLYMLANYLTTLLGCEVAVVGIQPVDTGLGCPLSAAVETAVWEVVEAGRNYLT